MIHRVLARRWLFDDARRRLRLAPPRLDLESCVATVKATPQGSGELKGSAARSALHNIPFITFIPVEKAFKTRMKGMKGIKDKVTSHPAWIAVLGTPMKKEISYPLSRVRRELAACSTRD